MNIKKLFYTSIYIIVLVFICSCATPKKKAPLRPKEKPQEPETSMKDTSEELENQRDREAALEKEAIASELEEKEYPGIEGEFLELPKLKDVYFEFDKYDLSPESCKKLANSVNLLKKLPNSKIQVEGHCDERGSAEYNLALGERRANSVKNYLNSLNYPEDNISTISYGEEMPVDQRHNEEAWAQNRRAHIIILSYEKD